MSVISFACFSIPVRDKIDNRITGIFHTSDVRIEKKQKRHEGFCLASRGLAKCAKKVISSVLFFCSHLTTMNIAFSGLSFDFLGKTC